MASSIRIKRELLKFDKDKADGIHLVKDLINDSDLSEIFVDIQVPGNPLYANDTYRIRFRIPPLYPIEVPWVQFVRTSPPIPGSQTASIFKIPLHPHIYSNGHICLDLLGDKWTPIHSIMSVSLSLQSMLSGNEVAERPEGDVQYIKRAPENPKETSWVYHDDTV